MKLLWIFSDISGLLSYFRLIAQMYYSLKSFCFPSDADDSGCVLLNTSRRVSTNNTNIHHLKNTLVQPVFHMWTQVQVSPGTRVSTFFLHTLSQFLFLLI